MRDGVQAQRCASVCVYDRARLPAHSAYVLVAARSRCDHAPSLRWTMARRQAPCSAGGPAPQASLPAGELATLEHGRNGRSRCDMALQPDSDRGARAADDYRSSADVLYPLQPLRRPERPSGSLPSLPVRTSGALLQWHTVKYQRDMCLGRVPRADTLRPIHRRALWQRCRIPSPVRVQHIIDSLHFSIYYTQGFQS